MSWTVMPDYDSYEIAKKEFQWNIPDDYNPIEDLLRKHEQPDQSVALIRDYPAETSRRYTFGDIDRISSNLAVGLRELGVQGEDRVGVLLPQCMEAPVSHLAIWKAGGITVPLTVLFGKDALEYRINDAEIETCIAWPDKESTIVQLKKDLQCLKNIITLSEEPSSDVTSFGQLVEEDVSGEYDEEEPTLDTPSAIMYTSGSTGPPKGVLHTFGIWLGRAAAHRNFFDQYGSDAVVWTPADWSWGTAMGGTLFGAWHHGAPIVATPMQGFDPGRAFAVLEEYDVTEAVIPPTALRMMMDVNHPYDEFELSLRTIASAGESVTPEIVDWINDEFDSISINEFYGQTELNLIVGNCSKWFETKPGSMGKPYPGYDVQLLDPETQESVNTGEVGEIAVRPSEREIFFNEYWKRPEATRNKQHDGYFLTGDLARQDEEGYLWFKSRKDDVIITSGYRVGPAEVEKTILKHPAVKQAAVIGVQDERRGEIIKAFVELDRDEYEEEDLCEEIRQLVRNNLAQYEYPREIDFVEKLPRTTTGKIRRSDLRETEPSSQKRH